MNTFEWFVPKTGKEGNVYTKASLMAAADHLRSLPNRSGYEESVLRSFEREIADWPEGGSNDQG